MKKCEKCGEFNADTDAVCKACGGVLPITEKWAASLRQGGKGGVPPREIGKVAATQRGPAPWSLTMACMGMALVLCSFIAGLVNAGLVLSLGASLSVGALVRLRAERSRSESTTIVAVLSLAVVLFCVVMYFSGMWKELYTPGPWGPGASAH